MKKKILLMLAVMAMLVCVFAISVSASALDITYTADFGEVTEIADMPTIDGISTEGRVVLKNDDGTYTTYPTYYIMKSSKTFGTDYENLKAKTGQAYDDSRMMMIEIPDGVTGISSNLFGMDSTNHPTTSLEKIVILSDDYTKITSQTFRRMPTVKSITIPASVVTIESWGFCGSPALQEVIFDGTPLVETIGNSFSGCTALSSINLGDCTSLKSIGGAFNGCTSLRKLALPDSLETIGDKAFYGIGEFELESNYLPSNLKTLGTHFLSKCTVKNEVLYFPEGFTDMSASYHFNDGFKANTHMTLVFFGNMTNINISSGILTGWTNNGSKKPLTIVLAQNTFEQLNGDFLQGIIQNDKEGYIITYADGTTPYTKKTNGTLTVSICNNDPNSHTSLGTDAAGNTILQAEGAPAELIFCGGETVTHCYSVRNNQTDKGWYRFFTSVFDYDIDAHTTANVHYDKIVVESLVNCGYDGVTKNTCVVCDRLASVVVPATNDHKYTVDNDCTTSHACEVCKELVIEAIEHKLSTTITYVTFDKAGTKTMACTNEGCTHGTTEEAPALFTCLGYSAPENGAGGIAIGFTVNNTAIKEYEAITGTTVKYGVFAILKDRLGDKNIFAEDGALAEGAIAAEISNHKFSAFELKIVGFADDQKGVELAMGAYVALTDGETTEYSYMQGGTPAEGENYYYVSYNDIVKPSTETDTPATDTGVTE